MFARLFLCVSVLLALASTASANSNVVVLGLRSVEGDDDVAKDLTEQLRGAARAVEAWTVSSTAVSMAQMSLAHGCDEIDAACLSEIAKGLRADTIIYGTIRRTSARDDYDFALNLNLFDAESGSIARQVDDTLARGQTDFQSLAAHADKLIARLSSTSNGGGIEVQANVADAEVSINGQQVGVTREGALRLQGLKPGRYRIEIRKDGYTPHISTVSVVEGADSSIAAVLSLVGAAPVSGPEAGPARHGGSDLEWLGWTLIGLSVASLVGTVASLMVVDGINSSPLYLRYRDAVAVGNKKATNAGVPEDVYNDVCKAADHGYMYTLTASKLVDVQDKCHTAATFEVMQWVFLGTALASGAVGAYLVLSADRQPDKGDLEQDVRRPAVFSLRPAFGPGSAHLSATLRF